MEDRAGGFPDRQRAAPQLFSTFMELHQAQSFQSMELPSYPSLDFAAAAAGIVQHSQPQPAGSRAGEAAPAHPTAPNPGQPAQYGAGPQFPPPHGAVGRIPWEAYLAHNQRQPQLPPGHLESILRGFSMYLAAAGTAAGAVRVDPSPAAAQTSQPAIPSMAAPAIPSVAAPAIPPMAAPPIPPTTAPAIPPTSASSEPEGGQQGSGQSADTRPRESQRIKREQNKCAQRRYRQRAKAQAAERDARFDDLERQLKVIRLENDRLTTCCASLQRELEDCRAAPSHACRRSTQLTKAAESSGPGCTEQSLEIEFARGTPWTHKSHISKWSFPSSSHLVLSLGPGEPKRLSIGEVAELQVPQFAAFYKEFVNSFAKCLGEEGHDDPSTPAGAHFLKLVSELNALLSTVAMTNPHTIISTFASKLEEPPVPFDEGSEQQLWRRVAEHIQLGPQQKAQLMHQRTSFLLRKGRLLKDRAGVLARLNSPTMNPMAAGEGPPLSGALNEYARMGEGATYLQACAALRSLRGIVHLEHLNVSLLHGGTYMAVLQPIQYAKAVVQSYPYGVDPLALAEVVAMAAGEPSSVTLMELGAQSATLTEPLMRQLREFADGVRHVAPCDADTDWN